MTDFLGTWYGCFAYGSNINVVLLDFQLGNNYEHGEGAKGNVERIYIYIYITLDKCIVVVLSSLNCLRIYKYSEVPRVPRHLF